MGEPKKLGVITHYYDKLGVGIVKLEQDLKVGDKLKFQGNKTDFEQIVEQMQFDHKDIEEATKGQEVGIKLDEKVRNGDEVFLTNSLAEVLPVTKVDSKKISSGKVGAITKLLRISYQKQVIREALR